MKFKVGDKIPNLSLRNIHGKEVLLPSSETKYVHVQFRRFAGCPICNLHLQSFILRNEELIKAGIREVVFFHSPNDKLLPYQGAFPFDVIGDPGKKYYRQFGVSASLLALLNPKVWPTMIKALLKKDKPSGSADGGSLGLPADFLIDSTGKIVACYYGSHAYDQWSFNQLLQLANSQGEK